MKELKKFTFREKEFISSDGDCVSDPSSAGFCVLH
jgi:hypothetical protein